MADLPSRSELFRRARAAAIATPNSRISAREIDRPGSDVNLAMTAMTFVGEEILARMAQALSGCFEDTAEDERLDRVVFDRKNLPRSPAEPAVVNLQLSRPTFAAGAGTIVGGLPGADPSPTRIQTNRGIVYILLDDAVFGATDLSIGDVRAQAQEAGLDSEVDLEQSWSFMDPPFDGTITIANAEEAAGASNEEGNDPYRARAKSFWPTVRRGTLEAVTYGVKSAPGVASSSTIETTSPGEGFPAGSTQSYILDALGRSNETFAQRARANLLGYRCAGVPAHVSSGVVQYFNVVFRNLTFDTSLVRNTVQGKKDVASAIVAATNNLRPGQMLERSLLLAAARTVRGIVLPNDVLEDPAGDLIPESPIHTFRTLRELISFLG